MPLRTVLGGQLDTGLRLIAGEIEWIGNKSIASLSNLDTSILLHETVSSYLDPISREWDYDKIDSCVSPDIA